MYFPVILISLWALPFYDGGESVLNEQNDSLEGWLLKSNAQVPAGSMNQR